ncbi:MAG: hypothetical protein PHD46_04210 [Eubacteriales bacterium]|nr:hypothetical protein [Eubacteriales bacterium]MDD4422223.1 hypothetical protein [Eubacteriales bacterium]HBR31279.1 hypothetical protein [Clostridiales bacterium]
MKKGLSKAIALTLIVFVLAIACVPMSAFKTQAAEPTYLTTGLEALYLGTNNTGSGHNSNAKSWADLSGKGRNIINIETDDNNHFTENAFLLNSKKVFLPVSVANVINGQAFSVEIVFGKFNSLGTDWNTFLNTSTGDSFAWFRTVMNDKLFFKSVPSGLQQNIRPEAAGALELLKNSTVTLTYKVGGLITMYVDGVQVGTTTSAEGALAVQDLFFGHDGAERRLEAEYMGMRFYSIELTAQQVASNYQQDLILRGTEGDESQAEESSETESSIVSEVSEVSESSENNVSSVASSDSSSDDTSEPVKTGDNDFLVISFTAALIAIVIVLALIRKRSIRA